MQEREPQIAFLSLKITEISTFCFGFELPDYKCIINVCRFSPVIDLFLTEERVDPR